MDRDDAIDWKIIAEQRLRVVEKLRTEVVESRRMIWMMVKAKDGFTLTHHDMVGYPGDDRAILDRIESASTRDVIFHARVGSGQGPT